MKTKLFFAAFGLFLFSQSIAAQEYHPMLNNSSWILRDYVSCCRLPQTWTIPAGEDVLVGDHTYKKFVNSSSASGNGSFIYLREDEDARKVYSLVNNTEVVLYDFSLLPGDVFEDFNVSVDYVEFNGLSRKRITLTRYDENYNINLTQVWIEGVGSPAHPFKPTINMYNALSSSGGRSVNLVCSFQDGQHIYGADDCETLRLGNDEFDVIETTEILFAPNPVENELTIIASVSLENATFKLFNSQGQLVREVQHMAGYQNIIYKDKLSSGFYFGQLLDSSGNLLKSGKILIK
ncbi:T9SS type A sorting domain-containing protein [Flavobacterium sp. CYK-4]|uniref:T9SS type A sorting domain-containing protein n=1 Tax=Flavobacterium lotistagni TaxID=2709660 RepID=UPI0014093C14|nr:T9SS type A sorting domain-containing protein [Flavobacterium lotistagni]NHM07714.1 T9SS type A sorting domain-containing protein [Flavobacterium lotistagni]